ncbi:hypothetical protein Dsin_024710 [Dipteronia sinensis]|uniref:Chromo domain-containing protein n=1 Tax=Dipteronia sinensis TaxID=43782 RepID=A0AAD9ZU93_9ROSI|nr:hypothetical protein Dsin_024710 [Dipteronia sinensis]
MPSWKEFDKAVQKVLDHRTVGNSNWNRRTGYLIQWKGESEADATWERGATLWQFEDLIQQYLERQPTRASTSSSGGENGLGMQKQAWMGKTGLAWKTGWACRNKLGWEKQAWYGNKLGIISDWGAVCRKRAGHAETSLDGKNKLGMENGLGMQKQAWMGKTSLAWKTGWACRNKLGWEKQVWHGLCACVKCETGTVLVYNELAW